MNTARVLVFTLMSFLFLWSSLAAGLEFPQINTNMTPDRFFMPLISLVAFAVPAFAMTRKMKKYASLVLMILGVVVFAGASVFSHIMTNNSGWYPSIEAPLWMLLT